jgi:hypothetical protein
MVDQLMVKVMMMSPCLRGVCGCVSVWVLGKESIYALAARGDGCFDLISERGLWGRIRFRTSKAASERKFPEGLKEILSASANKHSPPQMCIRTIQN